MNRWNLIRHISAFPLLVFCGFAFACKIILSKGALSAGMHPIQLGILGNLGAGLLLIPILIKTSGNLGFGKNNLILYFILAIISSAIPTVLSYWVVDKVGPAYTATVYSLSPLLTMTFAVGLHIERLSLRRCSAIIIGLAGMLLLVQQQITQINAQQPLWIILGLIIPVCAASGNIIRSRYWPKGTSALSFSCGMLLISSMVLMIICPFVESPQDWMFFQQDTAIWFGALLMMLAISTVANFQLQHLGGPVLFSQLGYWGTGFGVLLAAIIFDDVLTFSAIFGVVLIVIGGFLSRK